MHTSMDSGLTQAIATLYNTQGDRRQETGDRRQETGVPATQNSKLKTQNFLNSFTLSSCHLVILSSCHLVTLSSEAAEHQGGEYGGTAERGAAAADCGDRA